MTDADFDTHTEEREVRAFLQPLLERLRASAKTETVFGPSRDEGGRTIVPVAKVSYGAGGGSGRSGKRRKGAESTPESEEGTGAGAGINVSPLGVYELTDGGLRFVPAENSKVVALGAFVGGLVLGLLVARSGSGKR
jgi:uncharacterized spore protein YtfJ